MRIQKLLSIFRSKKLPMLKPNMVTYSIRPSEVVDVPINRFVNGVIMKDGFYKKTVDTNATGNYIRTVLNNPLP